MREKTTETVNEEITIDENASPSDNKDERPHVYHFTDAEGNARSVRLSDEERDALVNRGITAELQDMAKETKETKEPSDKQEKANLSPEDVAKQVEELRGEITNRERQREMEANRQKFTNELNTAINKHSDIAESKELTKIISDHVIAERYRGTNESTEKLVEKAVEGLTTAQKQKTKDYLDQKRQDAEKNQSISNMKSSTSTSPASDDVEKFNSKDLVQGKVRKRAAERLRAAEKQETGFTG